MRTTKTLEEKSTRNGEEGGGGRGGGEKSSNSRDNNNQIESNDGFVRIDDIVSHNQRDKNRYYPHRFGGGGGDSSSSSSSNNNNKQMDKDLSASSSEKKDKLPPISSVKKQSHHQIPISNFYNNNNNCIKNTNHHLHLSNAEPPLPKSMAKKTFLKSSSTTTSSSIIKSKNVASSSSSPSNINDNNITGQFKIATSPALENANSNRIETESLPSYPSSAYSSPSSSKHLGTLRKTHQHHQINLEKSQRLAASAATTAKPNALQKEKNYQAFHQHHHRRDPLIIHNPTATQRPSLSDSKTIRRQTRGSDSIIPSTSSSSSSLSSSSSFSSASNSSSKQENSFDEDSDYLLALHLSLQQEEEAEKQQFQQIIQEDNTDSDPSSGFQSDATSTVDYLRRLNDQQTALLHQFELLPSQQQPEQQQVDQLLPPFVDTQSILAHYEQILSLFNHNHLSSSPSSSPSSSWQNDAPINQHYYNDYEFENIDRARGLIAEPEDMSYEQLVQLEDVRPGLEREKLDMLPIIAYNPPPRSSSSSASPSSASFCSCPICLMDYEPDDQIRIAPCAHQFHLLCIDTWLQQSKSCPVCKFSIEEMLLLTQKKLLRT